MIKPNEIINFYYFGGVYGFLFGSIPVRRACLFSVRYAFDVLVLGKNGGRKVGASSQKGDVQPHFKPSFGHCHYDRDAIVFRDNGDVGRTCRFGHYAVFADDLRDPRREYRYDHDRMDPLAFGDQFIFRVCADAQTCQFLSRRCSDRNFTFDVFQIRSETDCGKRDGRVRTSDVRHGDDEQRGQPACGMVGIPNHDPLARESDRRFAFGVGIYGGRAEFGGFDRCLAGAVFNGIAQRGHDDPDRDGIEYRNLRHLTDLLYRNEYGREARGDDAPFDQGVRRVALLAHLPDRKRSRMASVYRYRDHPLGNRADPYHL